MINPDHFDVFLVKVMKLLFLAILCSSSSAGELVLGPTPVFEPALSGEERLELECSSAIRFYKVCRTSFYRVAAKPEAYHGRVISIVGFLVIDNGELTMYASMDDYDYMASGASITLLVPNEEITALVRNKLYGYVMAFGHFDASSLNPDRPRLGAMTLVGGLHTMDRRTIREQEVYIRSDELEEGS